MYFRFLKKIFVFLIFIFLQQKSFSQSNQPPQLVVTGDQIFCPLNQINIVTDFDIIPGDDEIDTIFIQVSENYTQGEDTLLLTGSHSNVSTSWSASEGKLTLTALIPSPTAYIDLIAAVKEVVFQSTSNSITGEKHFSITVDEANYLPSTQHYYEYVHNVDITWTNAKIAAEARTHYGLQGYLATISSPEEAQLTGEQAPGEGWIGGSDAAVEGSWKWVTGPEAGMVFWNGLANGSSPSGVYSNWAADEPNDWPNANIAKEENYAHIYETGKWNDYPNFNTSIKGYVVEYGGMPGDPIVDISASTKISVDTINSTTSGSTCGTGSVSLSATTSLGGNVAWFDSLTGGNLVSDKLNFITPPISTTTTYYVLASADGFCKEGQRTPVTATVLNIPTITSTKDTKICGAGTGILSATASRGIINWYTNETGGSPVANGENFSPTVANTTTYYVDTSENGCTTLNRIAVTLNVQHTSAPTGVITQTFCDVQLASVADLSIVGDKILWYDAALGGNLINTTELLKNNTTYFASQTINECEGPSRLAIISLVYETVVPLKPVDIPILNECDNNLDGDDTNGFKTTDLTKIDTNLLNGKSKTDFAITYFTDPAYSSKIVNPTSFQNTKAGGQTIYVRMANKLDNTCFTDISFELKINPLPILITSEVTLEQCDNDENNDGFSIFNLNEANELISTNYQNETFEFYKDSGYSQIITNPLNYANPIVINSSVFVIIRTNNLCERFAKIYLKVGATQIPNNFHLDYYSCEDYPSNNQDGRTLFNFSDVEQKLIDTKSVFSSQKVRISYFENLENALSEINAISKFSNYKNTNPWEQKIYARIDSDDVNSCLGLNHIITLHVEQLPVANPVTIERECDDDFDGLFPFDSSTIESSVLSGQTGMLVSYFDENGAVLPSPLPTPFLTETQTITIRVTDSNSVDPEGACFDETTLEFIVDKKPVANTVPNIFECDDDSDGILNIDTSTIENLVLKGQTGMLVTYFDELGNPLPSPLPNPFSTTSQTITIKVENELNSNCNAETTLQFKVYQKPEFELDSTAIYCTNLPPITIETYNAKGNYSYEWKDDFDTTISTKSVALISREGKYTVIATSNEGCTSFPRTITVEGSSIASISQNDITVIDDSENNSITITTSNLGIGDYEFALEKENYFIQFYQDDPFFDQLSPGIYTLFIRDKNNCGIAQIDFSVIGFPKFFTPNNDGSNDTWRILGVNKLFYGSSAIYIFDRYGKLITKINPSGNGWEGTLNGKLLPSTDYWFSVELIDNIGNTRVRKGHFSLIR